MYIFAFVCVVYVLPQRNAVKNKTKTKKTYFDDFYPNHSSSMT